MLQPPIKIVGSVAKVYVSFDGVHHRLHAVPSGQLQDLGGARISGGWLTSEPPLCRRLLVILPRRGSKGAVWPPNRMTSSPETRVGAQGAA